MTKAPQPGGAPEDVFALSGPPSLVAGRESPWKFTAGLAGTFGLGLIVFLSLSAGRHSRAQAALPPLRPVQLAQAAPPAPVAPVQPPAPEAPPPVDDSANAALAAQEAARLRAPSMIVDLSQPTEPATLSGTRVAQATPGAPGAPGTRPPGGGGAKLGSDERFAEKVESAQVETAEATRLTNTALVAPQGTVISAVLETGINSDVPGFARAVVSRDISGFDGSTIVIPRGSRLIGEYKSGVANGQSRAFVIWTRLITPDGVSISLGSPGTDRLGRGGLEGKANSHFFHRFGAAILLSVIDGAVQALVNQNSSGINGIVISSPQQAANVASIALQKDIDIPTTITVPQGQSIRVFVARDLDFSGVMQAR
jgi:type IV secretory pathway VirB10-like protein